MSKTNAEVAAILGVSPSMASRMRAGIRVGSLNVLARLSDYTGRPIDEVVGAARAANDGDGAVWKDIMAGIYEDSESEPEPAAAV